MVNHMNERTGVIYEGYCLPTGLSYIGKTLNFSKRRAGHLWDAKNRSEDYFHLAIRKYGADAFAWRILVDGIPFSQLDTQEIFWIRFRNTYLGPGYNMTAGGEASPTSNPDVAKKVKESHLRNMANGTHIFVTNHPMKNPESVEKLRESHRLRIEDGTHNFLADNPNLKRIEDGTHNFITDNPMRDPKISARIWATRRRKNREALAEMGQQFLFDDDDECNR